MKSRRILVGLCLLLLMIPAAYALNPADTEGGTLGDAGDSWSSATHIYEGGGGRLTWLVDTVDWYRFHIGDDEAFAARFLSDDGVRGELWSPSGASYHPGSGFLMTGDEAGVWQMGFRLTSGTGASYGYDLIIGHVNNTTDAAAEREIPAEPVQEPDEGPAETAAEEPVEENATDEPVAVAPTPGTEPVGPADLTIEVEVSDPSGGLLGDALEAKRLIKLRVVNHGDADTTQAFGVQLRIEAASMQGIAGQSYRWFWVENNLTSGAELTFEHFWDTSRAAGQYFVVAKVDAFHEIDEPVESDNLATEETYVRLPW